MTSPDWPIGVQVVAGLGPFWGLLALLGSIWKGVAFRVLLALLGTIYAWATLIVVSIRRRASAWHQLGIAGGGQMFDGDSRRTSSSEAGRNYSGTECFQKALALYPKYSHAWFFLGNAGGGLVKGRNYSEAECFARAVRLNPMNGWAWFKLAIQAGHDQNRAVCKSEPALLRKALALQPNNVDAWCEVGYIGGDFVNGKNYTAADCYQQAVALDPEFLRAWDDLAAAGGGHGEQYNRTACYQNFIALDPSNANAWNNLARLGGGTVNKKEY